MPRLKWKAPVQQTYHQVKSYGRVGKIPVLHITNEGLEYMKNSFMWMNKRKKARRKEGKEKKEKERKKGKFTSHTKCQHYYVWRSCVVIQSCTSMEM